MGSVEESSTQNGIPKDHERSNPQFTFNATRFASDSFWGRRRQIVRLNTVQAQLDMLRSTGRYNAFDLKWHPSYNDPPTVWPVPNHLFWDSDVAKWIEGACYYLVENDDPETRLAVQDLVGKIGRAQSDDGYLNIHFTVVEPDKRFTNLRDFHELYNAGHLIEAALIHRECFRNDDLLSPVLKYVHLLHRTFGRGSGQIHGYPGHPEIELALVRLWRATGDIRSLELARYFIEERGNPSGVDGKHYYDVEAEKRGDRPNERPAYYPERRSYWYYQAHKPLLEQQTIEGHSVRAMYLLTAVADLASVDKQNFRPKYLETLHRLWDNMVDRKMYLTGGIGAIKQWEGFGVEYFLPQSSDEGGCYSETCAAIGVMMLAERILQLELNSKYADILELCLYNSVLTGMSLDGKAFTYDNQLASSPGLPSKREDWFETACCPPNVSRVFGYLGGYIWSLTQEQSNGLAINVHLYTSATITSEVGANKLRLTQKTNWPWSGDVDFEVDRTADVDLTVRLRIPQWSKGFEITPAPPSYTLSKGYITLPPTYLAANSSFRLSIRMNPRLVTPHPYTNQQIAAVARGPIVYCAEDVDNPWVTDHFKSVVLDTSVPLSESEGIDLQYSLGAEKQQMRENYIAITAENAARFLKLDCPADQGFAFEPGTGPVLRIEKGKQETLKFIPYFARANRGGNGMMRVGLRVGAVKEM